MPTIKKHNIRRVAKKRTAERTTHLNSEDRNAPITAVESKPLQSIVINKVSRNQSTSSPDED